ncbi:DUF1828 domain-containing protein [Lactobacillus sp. ESL0228]|uniref:DUF1828 domain-containing protein n=1 Tax=Lactobacillus sp. ESL0228 TaxID=2069352 RepID=UPI000EFA9061|nr:DUF1828 domain-containing protein [Lactobacillus sp. ESL0228]RMC48714.1 DUF1828 domain-containing protein [Lactobacillus sp. ESL0228]
MAAKIFLGYDNLKTKLVDWLAANTQVIQFDDETIEIMTPVKDALKDDIYCFVTKKTKGYQVSDDGRCLFKLDPSASDSELFEEAAEVVANAKFKINIDSWIISTLTDEKNLMETIMRLAYIQAAISYLV